MFNAGAGGATSRDWWWEIPKFGTWKRLENHGDVIWHVQPPKANMEHNPHKKWRFGRWYDSFCTKIIQIQIYNQYLYTHKFPSCSLKNVSPPLFNFPNRVFFLLRNENTKMAPPYPSILPTTMWRRRRQWPPPLALDRLDRPLVEARSWLPRDDGSDVSGRLRRLVRHPASD